MRCKLEARCLANRSWSLLLSAALAVTACSDGQVDSSAEAGSATAEVATTRFDTIAHLSFAGHTTPGAAAPVAVSSDVDRIAVGIRDGGEIFIFDDDGQLLQNFGQTGEGPGEYTEISHLMFHPSTDSLFVLDRGAGRISVLAPGAERPSRDLRLPGRFHGVAWASDARLFVQGEFPNRSVADRHAYGVAVEGDSIVAAAFGPGIPAMGGLGAGIRPTTSSAEGGLWVGHFREPSLRRLNAELEETASYEFESPYLAGTPENAEIWDQVIDAEPAVLEFTQQPNGALWILFGVPRDPLPRVPDPWQALSSGEVETPDLATTILARFDPDALSSGPVEEFEWCPRRIGLLPNGLAYCFSSDPVGEAELTLVRLVS